MGKKAVGGRRERGAIQENIETTIAERRSQEDRQWSRLTWRRRGLDTMGATHASRGGRIKARKEAAWARETRKVRAGTSVGQRRVSGM